MAQSSPIEWTEATWNPDTGCSKISTGCQHCYAERMAKRLQAMGMPQYRNGFSVTLQPNMLALPLQWKKPRLVFVCSMGDLFHEDVPLDFIRQVFEVMKQASQHTFQVLTKRPERTLEYATELSWPSNVWIGTTVENALYVHRIKTLARIPAQLRFLSLEPLLGPVPRLPLRGVHWVIVGGESGPGARPMKKEWVTRIRDRCLAQGVPFFFKQWGGVNKKRAGRTLDGRTWNDMPSSSQSKESTLVRVAAS